MFQSSGMLHQCFLKAGIRFCAAWLRALKPLARFESWIRGVPFPPSYSQDQIEKQQLEAEEKYLLANIVISPPPPAEYETLIWESHSNPSVIGENRQSPFLSLSLSGLYPPSPQDTTVVLVPIRELFDDPYLKTTLYSRLKSQGEVIRRTLADPSFQGFFNSFDDKRAFLESKKILPQQQN